MLMGLSDEDWLLLLGVIGVPMVVFGVLVFLLRKRVIVSSAWAGVLFIALAAIYGFIVIIKKVQ